MCLLTQAASFPKGFDDVQGRPSGRLDLYSAMMEHREYDGCYVMQYSEYRDSEGRMIGEFMLREAN